MPLIMPIKDLINTTENGYSDINRIDQSIYESEKEMDKGGKSYDLDEAFELLNKKYGRNL